MSTYVILRHSDFNLFDLKSCHFHVFLSHLISIGFLFFYFQQSFLNADFTMFTNSRGYGGRWRGEPSCFHFNQWYSKDNVLKSLWESLKHRSNLHSILFYRAGVILGNCFGRKWYCWFLHKIILWKHTAYSSTFSYFIKSTAFSSQYMHLHVLFLSEKVAYMYLGLERLRVGLIFLWAYTGPNWIAWMDLLKRKQFYVCV